MESITPMKLDDDTLVAFRLAVQDCSERGLVVASKWMSELLLSLSPAKRAAQLSTRTTFHTSTPARPRSPRPSMSFTAQTPGPERGVALVPQHPLAPQLQQQPPDIREREMQLEALDADHIAHARALLDVKEYARAVYWLKDCDSAKAIFLRVYCQFLASEKKAQRDWYKLDNTRQQPQMPVNDSLITLLQEVQNSTDPWLLFLKALFLQRLSRREEAIESALLSIAGYPFNWSAWTLLQECLEDGEELSTLMPLIPLPHNHPITLLFHVKTMNSLSISSEVEMHLCDTMLGEDFFPRSTWVMSQRACALYHMHDYGTAEIQFQKIRAVDPYRMDDIDIYSNILYVLENRLELSKLAHELLPLEKDRPEICCLIGNHYSLRAEHEKAIKYFRRATQLDRTYLSAWTLMGHEYVEMKNSHAAIEAYRKGVDVNRKDYRAWYGLGQAYELLTMHQYALYYYQHATALRPYDVRIWQAQGLCYEEMGRPREAIECLKRALMSSNHPAPHLYTKLAKLHDSLEEHMEAAAYHQKVIDLAVASNKTVPEYAKSSMYVARYHLHHGGGDLQHAKALMEAVAASQSEEVTAGTDLLKKIKAAIVTKHQVEAVEAAKAQAAVVGGL